MGESKRDDFSASVKNNLAKRAGYRCSNPNCRKLTIGANTDPEKATSVGVAAHNTAASPGGPRYDEKLSSEERKSILNGIWLCVTCSTLIDKDKSRFTKTILDKWKADIEYESSKEIATNNVKSTIGIAKGNVSKKLTIEERAELTKETRRRKEEIKKFLKSPSAIEVAQEQVSILIEKLKNTKETLTDDSIGFSFGQISHGINMYGIGLGDNYIRFNWFRPDIYDTNEAMLKVSLVEITGAFGIDMIETPIERGRYKYTRNINGHDGWAQLDSGENFITTEDLFELWIDKYLDWIEFEN